MEVFIKVPGLFILPCKTYISLEKKSSVPSKAFMYGGEAEFTGTRSIAGNSQRAVAAIF